MESSTGGKSELYRAGCRLTAGGGDPKASATEMKTADGESDLSQVRMQRCGKSAPAAWRHAG